MSEKTIALLLKSPIQSWGVDSKFGQRGTFDYPTKSGIAGVICAAAGIDKYSDAANDELAEMSKFRLDVFRVANVRGAGRGQAPLLSDYHTVGGGYSQSEPLHRGMFSKNKNNAILSVRKYIQDACFIALLTADESLCDKIAEALKNPKWGVWLGRKCCIPSLPLFAGVADTPEEAKESALSILRDLGYGDAERKTIGECLECGAFDEAEMSIADSPIDYKSRKFAARNIITQ